MNKDNNWKVEAAATWKMKMINQGKVFYTSGIDF